MKRNYLILFVNMGLVALLYGASPALAATAPALGATSTYGVVSETYTGNGAATIISGNVCYTTGPGTFAPTIIGGGALFVPCTNGGDQATALANLNSQACTSLGAAVALNTINLGSGPGVFPPGCYSSTGAMSVTTGTTVTLSGAGVYIFRPGGALDPAANSNVVVAGGACEADVFWAPIGATTLGANSSFVGTIFRGTAAGLSITIGNSSSLIGRALAFGSTVTTDTNTITVPTCPAFGSGGGGGGGGGGGAAIPTLSEWAMIVLALLVVIAGFAAMRRRQSI